MNTIIINSVAVCDATQTVLPQDGSGNYLAPIAPKPTGATGILYVQIICTLVPDGAGQIKYRLRLQNRAHWQLTGANPDFIDYQLPTSDGAPEYLPFGLQLLVPYDTALPANIRITACDPAPVPPNVAVDNVSIVGV